MRETLRVIYYNHEYRIKCGTVVRLRHLGMWGLAAVAGAVVRNRTGDVSIAAVA
jgi:hypothetical protein